MLETIQTSKNDIFQKKIDIFMEQNSIKDQSLQLLKSSNNGMQKMEEYNFQILGEEAINALIAYDEKILNILYFETTNGNNENNQTSKSINLPGAGRFSIFNFIKIAKEKGLKEIKFDIMKSELGFYKKINNELIESPLIQNSYIKNFRDFDCFVVNL